jgi:hypothetical protein
MKSGSPGVMNTWRTAVRTKSQRNGVKPENKFLIGMLDMIVKRIQAQKKITSGRTPLS